MENNILRLKLPKETYIDNALLEEMYNFIVEEYMSPIDALHHAGIDSRYWAIWERASNAGDDQARYILERLKYAQRVWIGDSRKGIHKSKNMVARTKDLENVENRETLSGLDDFIEDGWI